MARRGCSEARSNAPDLRSGGPQGPREFESPPQRPSRVLIDLMKGILPGRRDAGWVYDSLRPEKSREPLDRLADFRGDLLVAGSAALRVDRLDQELLVLLVEEQINSADEPVPPQDRVHEGPEFPFVRRQEVFVDVVEAKQSIRPAQIGRASCRERV